MILNSTKYKNPERTIVGTALPVVNQVSNADTIILCDTSLGAVILQLLEIPNDKWNTTYKLYIADKSNNASVNNITINAPVGFTINNQSSLVISTNGGAVVIRVASNTGYLGNLTINSGGSVSVVNQQNPFAVPTTLTTALKKLIVNGFSTTNSGDDVTLQNAFVEIDTNQLDFLILNNGLIPNQIYKVSKFHFGLAPESYNVFLKATSKNTLDQYGTGEFYNADYNGTGDYSGVSGFSGYLGIWQPSLMVSIGNVVVWNNYHYVNISGLNPSSPPDMVSDWKQLSFSISNGYFLEYDLIQWAYTKAYLILGRIDKYGNEVEFYVDNGGTGLCSLNRFQWGNSICNQNKVQGNSIFDNCNVIINTRMSNNYVFNTILYLTDFLKPSSFDNFQSNNFIDHQRPLNIFGYSTDNQFINNHFELTIGIAGLTLTHSVTFNFNKFVQSSIRGSLENCFFFKNNISSFSIDITKTSGNFVENQFHFGNLFISSSTGDEVANTINNGSITIQDNKGAVRENCLQNASYFDINVNDTLGLIRYNQLNNFSFIQVTTTNQGSIGDGTPKGIANTLNNVSSFVFDTFTAGRSVYQNVLNGSSVQIDLVDGSLGFNNFDSSKIVLASMNAHTIVGTSLKNGSLGTTGYVLPQTFSGGQFVDGNGSIKANLDCSNPAIYDLATTTLTIPAELSSFAGVYTLQNANGIIITKIVGLYDRFQTTINNDFGTTKFGVVSVGVAVAHEIIGDASVPALININYRINGTDSIFVTALGTLCGITGTNLYV